MEAGPELNALVATEVMGLEIEWNINTPCPYCHMEMRYCGSRARCTQCGEWRYGPYKDYSEDIAAAGEVVEATLKSLAESEEGKTFESGWVDNGFMLEISADGSAEAGFVRDDRDYYHESWKYWAKGKDAMEAICLAALAAKGVEV